MNKVEQAFKGTWAACRHRASAEICGAGDRVEMWLRFGKQIVFEFGLAEYGL